VAFIINKCHLESFVKKTTSHFTIKSFN
jgi:hypothetical protein